MISFKSVKQVGNQYHISQEIDLKDGTVGTLTHVLPVVAYVIRAGEYNLDPVADADDIWDMLLYEIHIDDPAEASVSPLVEADTLEEARDLHLSRCRHHKDRLTKRPLAKGRTHDQEVHDDVVNQLKAMVPHDEETHALVRKHTKKHALARKGLVAAKPVTEDPLAVLKAELLERQDHAKVYHPEHAFVPGGGDNADRSVQSGHAAVGEAGGGGDS